MCNVVLGFNVCFQVAGMFVLHVNGSKIFVNVFKRLGFRNRDYIGSA